MASCRRWIRSIAPVLHGKQCQLRSLPFRTDDHVTLREAPAASLFALWMLQRCISSPLPREAWISMQLRWTPSWLSSMHGSNRRSSASTAVRLCSQCYHGDVSHRPCTEGQGLCPNQSGVWLLAFLKCLSGVLRAQRTVHYVHPHTHTHIHTHQWRSLHCPHPSKFTKTDFPVQDLVLLLVVVGSQGCHVMMN